MASQKIRLTKLIEGVANGSLNNNEERKLLRKLTKKLLREGLDSFSFREKVVLSAFLLYDDKITRTEYIRGEMKKWLEKININR